MARVSVDVEIDLDGCDTDELIEELESRGYSCKKDSEPVEGFDLDRIEHLTICGQKEAARIELFKMVGAAIGLDLAH